MKLSEFANRLSKLNVEGLKVRAVENKAALIEDLQRKQFRQGQDAQGVSLKPYRSDSYARYKGSLSTYYAPMGTPDLYLSGDFARGIKMKLTGNEYFLDSSDSKSDKLTSKYGDIWGLNGTTLPQAKVNVTNEFNKLVRQQLGI